MMPAGQSAAEIYTDLNGLAQLKTQARNQSPEALKQTAQQFEALFLQMMLKNMRQASEPLESNLVDGNGTRMFKDMHDQQMAVQLAKNSNIGFADMLVKQLGPSSKTDAADLHGKSLEDYRHTSVRMVALHKPASTEATQINNNDTPAKPLAMPKRDAVRASHDVSANPSHPVKKPSPAFANEKAFFQELLPQAEAAAKELGIDPKLLLSQVALETGWGKSGVRRGDGSATHNMFGIKADSNWDGKRVASSTLEYEQGVAVRKTDYFRAYDSYADSFHDYVGFVRDNPRYAEALSKADDPKQYMLALQKAGYATDPQYANKVMSIYQQWRDVEVDTPTIAAADHATTTDESPKRET